MNKRRAIISCVLSIMLVGFAAWAFGFFNRSNPAVAELQQLGSQMWDRSLPDDQRNQLRTDFRQRMESMTDDQRRAFFDANRDQWTGRMQQRMDEYFAMPKADQQKRLDEILNRIAQAQKSQQQNASSQRNRGAGNSRGGGRNMTDAQREERSKRRLDRTTPKMRAQFSEFRRQLDSRAQQRGIQLGDQRGRDFGGFPRGV
jgi:uncharacterized membrane protein